MEDITFSPSSILVLSLSTAQRKCMHASVVSFIRYFIFNYTFFTVDSPILFILTLLSHFCVNLSLPKATKDQCLLKEFCSSHRPCLGLPRCCCMKYWRFNKILRSALTVSAPRQYSFSSLIQRWLTLKTRCLHLRTVIDVRYNWFCWVARIPVSFFSFQIVLDHTFLSLFFFISSTRIKFYIHTLIASAC